MAEGTWDLSLKDGEQTLITSSFVVDHNTPLHVPLENQAEAKEIGVGRYIITDLGKEKFTKATKMGSMDHVAVWTRWKPLHHDHRIIYRWKSPSGQISEYYFDVKQGWDQTYVNFDKAKPLEVGDWEVSLWDGGRKLISESFSINPGNSGQGK